MKAIDITFTIRPYVWVRNITAGAVCAAAVLIPQRISVANDRHSITSPISLYRSHHVEIIRDELVAKASDLNAGEANDVARAIVEEAMEAHYDPLFILAIIDAESNFRVEAVSKSGARGLMQILPSTFKSVSDARRMLDPVENVRAGIRYLGTLSVFKKIDTILLAYNQGPGTAQSVMRYGHEIPEEAAAYLPRVTAKYKSLLERNGRNPKLAHKSFRVSPTQYASVLQTSGADSRGQFTISGRSALASYP
jgi:soluble lytic murein transglycosylase-like protein